MNKNNFGGQSSAGDSGRIDQTNFLSSLFDSSTAKPAPTSEVKWHPVVCSYCSDAEKNCRYCRGRNYTDKL